MRLAVVLLSALFIFSCNNEVNVNANWKQIGIVYGLLNKNDTIHYLKINKAYLNNESNALEIAAIRDSLYFNEEDLIVTISNRADVTTLSRIFIEDEKDSGLFSNPGQYVYVTPKGFQIKAGGIYTLNIKDTRTGYEMSSSASLVQDGSILLPSSISQKVSFCKCTPQYDLEYYYTRTMGIKAGKFAKFYDFDLTFHYQEIDPAIGNDTIDKELSWRVGTFYKLQNTRGTEEVSVDFGTEGFFKLLEKSIEEKDGVKRFVGPITFAYHAGGQEIYDYINVNKPSIGIVQKKPEYSNIENGIGVFSSRNSQETTKRVDECTRRQIVSGPYTKRLGFVR